MLGEIGARKTAKGFVPAWWLELECRAVSPNTRDMGVLRVPYEKLKKLARESLGSEVVSEQILELVLTSLRFLQEECSATALISRTPQKTFLAYARKLTPDQLSRPINAGLFRASPDVIAKQWHDWTSGLGLGRDAIQLLYTMVMAFCVAVDLFDRNNKKMSATYFEFFIGHIFSREIQADPSKKTTFPLLGKSFRMTMDFLFDRGPGTVKIHLPVKMSTRERVVQAWAHQRLLDVFSPGQYKGILVIFSETKLNLRTKEVVEICVPDQWVIYQSLLAKMSRIYYFDVPGRYRTLAKTFPIIPLHQFDHFFAEKEKMLGEPLSQA